MRRWALPLTYLVDTIYPNCCVVCSIELKRSEASVCLDCHLKLPQTDMHLYQDNPVERIFYGRVEVESASACLTFRKSGAVQKVMHHIKYRGGRTTAQSLGHWYGSVLAEAECYATCTHIIPVPLHKKKLRQRGYNQSEWLAKGLSQGLGIKVDTQSLIRSKATTSQTKKSRIARWLNVKDSFSLKEPNSLAGAHVLLVDDVVTTGATLEACIRTLQSEGKDTRVSVITLAYATS